MENSVSYFYQFILDYSEIIGTLLGIPFFILLVLEKPIAFLFGATSSAFFLLTNWQLSYYSNALVMLYYVIIGIYGFIVWFFPKKDLTVTNKNNQTPMLAVSSSTCMHTIISISIGLIISIVLFIVMHNSEFTIMFILDSLTAGFAIVAYYLQAKKIIETWFYWIIIDTTLTGMYFVGHAYYYAFYAFFGLVISICGYFSWKKSMLLNNKTSNI